MKTKFWKVSALLLAFTATTVHAKEEFGEEFNPVTNLTGVPFLTITPDSRAGGMGDVGAATTADVNSQYWNPSKYAFIESKAGFVLNYTPWLRKLVNDIDLINATGYYKIGNENNQAISASLRYFSLGTIPIINNENDPGYEIKPSEFTLDLAYSRRLSQNFSMGVAFRYIFSDITADAEESPAQAFGADISALYQRPVMVGNYEGRWGIGVNISNIGTKLDYGYDGQTQFLPTNLRLGGSFLYPIDEYNSISLNLDLNKMLTPTPPMRGADEESQDFELRMQEARNQSSIGAIFSSFSDAPGGFKEELQEVTWSVGAEYVYNKQFSVRAGYYNEHQNKGNRKYVSMGVGFKLNIFSIDAAYLISMAQASPLDQTLRFSLAFDIAGLRSLVR